MSAELKVPKNTVASIIKWKKFGNAKTLPRAGRPAKLSNHGRSALVREVTALVREVTKNPMDTDRAPEFLCGDGCPSGSFSHLCGTTPIRP
jgi:hypothetical protein